MKLTKLSIIGLVAFSSIFAASTPASAALETGQAAKITSTGSITMRSDGDETGENTGALRIGNVSNITFADQLISGDNQVYRANFKAADTEGNLNPDSIQVIDNRGSNKGWTLQVSNDGFASVDGTIPLAATKLKINATGASNLSGNLIPTIAGGGLRSVELGADGFKTLVNSKVNEGIGTTTTTFGTATTDAATKNADITLSIPGSSAKVKDTTYQTTLTWLLLDDPSN
ncbi:WxL domain-containing protein [Carnobacterium gallinarum]|uniref:WxL domain-containing protein n=1 Tax=Carnobacterium gallinarum TaxID=2749 RepID=UPI0005581DBD|nr:WxL domain-containing protein [Carnobacterium gallinarum]